MVAETAAEAIADARNRHGAFIWYELMSAEPNAAAAFYAAVAGWTVRDIASGGSPGYRIFHAPDGDGIAGLLPLSNEARAAGARPGWLGYVGVDDVDATVEAARSAGATVPMPATDLPGVGRIAMIADPDRAPIYVMRGASELPSTSFSPNAEGHCAWNELATDRPDAAIGFDSSLFGWTAGERLPMGALGSYQLLEHGGESFGAVMPRMPGGPPASWTFYFRVPAIDAAAARVTQAGGTLLHGPAEVPGGSFILIGADPHGAVFALIGPR